MVMVGGGDESLIHSQLTTNGYTYTLKLTLTLDNTIYGIKRQWCGFGDDDYGVIIWFKQLSFTLHILIIYEFWMRVIYGIDKQ